MSRTLESILNIKTVISRFIPKRIPAKGTAILAIIASTLRGLDSEGADIQIGLTCDLQLEPPRVGKQEILSIIVDRIGGAKDTRNFPISGWTNQVSKVRISLMEQNDYVLTAVHSVYENNILDSSSPNPSIRYTTGKINLGDTNPPVSMLNFPATTENAKVNLPGIVMDESHVYLSIFGDCINPYSDLNGTGGSYTASFLLAKAGINNISLVFKDASGNYLTNSGTIECTDYHGPAVSVNNYNSNSLSRAFAFTGNMSDINPSAKMEIGGDVEHSSFYIDKANGNWNASALANKDGPVNIALKFYDAIGNYTTVTNTGFVDSGIDSDGDGLTDVMERHVGTDPSNKDTDRDGLEDQLELQLGYDPKDMDSYLKITGIRRVNASDVEVTIYAVPWRTFQLEATTGLNAQYSFVASGSIQFGNRLVLTDTNADQNATFKLYRAVASPKTDNPINR